MGLRKEKKGKKRASPIAQETQEKSVDGTGPTGEISESLEVEDTSIPVEILPPEHEQEEERSTERGIVRYDPFEAYLNEVRRHPPLSKEEEHDLAVRYQTTKDLDAAYRLVSANLWLVVKLARDYERAARSILDLIQEGNIGLMEAVKNFDPYRGVRFPSYAVWWIRAYIIRFVIANWRLVKIGTTQAQRRLFFNLNKEKEKLEREGFWPGPKLLAERLNVNESEIVEMEQRLGSPDVSVDAPLQDDSDSSLLSVLPSQGMSAEDLLASQEYREIVRSALDDFMKTLTEKERTILLARVVNEEKSTLHEVAEKYSISKERVRQIENKIKDRLKEFFIARLKARGESVEIG